MSRDKAEIIAYAIRKEYQKCYWYETYGITFDEFEEFLSNGILNNARIHITVEELQKFIDAINALEQSPETEQFAKWVATEIFDDMWEYNKDSFAEIACRKLTKLGIVRAKGDEWELVEPQESEEV